MRSTLFRHVITGFVCSRRDGDAMTGPGRAASCRAPASRAEPSRAPPRRGGTGPPRAAGHCRRLPKFTECSRKQPSAPEGSPAVAPRVPAVRTASPRLRPPRSTTPGPPQAVGQPRAAAPCGAPHGAEAAPLGERRQREPSSRPAGLYGVGFAPCPHAALSAQQRTCPQGELLGGGLSSARHSCVIS